MNTPATPADEAKARECSTCKGAGTVWARANALPYGFKVFCGPALERSEDRQHVQIVCPTCNGEQS